AVDPDYPDFVLPTRKPDGSLDPAGVVSPVTYSVSGLPAGATFDAATATFHWVPGYAQAGQYNLFVIATDNDGAKALSAQITVPATVRNVNRPPIISATANVRINRGEVLDLPVTVTDPDGDPLVLTALNAITNQPFPRFATFTDNHDRT